MVDYIIDSIKFAPLILVIIAVASYYILPNRHKDSFSRLLTHIGTTILYSIRGAIAGYLFGLIYCLLPEAGDLCGFVAVFFTAPLGLYAGALYYQYKFSKELKNHNKPSN